MSAGTTERQLRLRLKTADGELDLVPWRLAAGDPLRWSRPGGGSWTYSAVVRHCRARAWPRPELVSVRVVRRAETEETESTPPTGDNHGQ
jgi:hypothetical protein